MKVLPIILMALLISTSCANNEDVPLELDSSAKQVIFLSDETESANLQTEAPYYDAIIELRQQFPNEFKNMKTISPHKAEDYFDSIEKKECPALLVIQNDKILVKIVGKSSKEEIIQPIEAALAN
ncbi:small peptidoglycan-associated lipoprotein [Robertmurraya yapensis]|uniref:Small peptidoglycan-associated lipoprotein n=2 Tax=Bacillaceae TaxID=186817 RepID=A0A431WAM1_9BACI|nr:small peptidoglycan-associated lipoprotein [Bacillus yapensis]RTR32389.1 small peptidoglycan-associated lipoprotein [Bacillus yapensis]TKS96583.1 small peptidoglycan-associated lipoprotein [Bacillus yapensis]